MPQSAISSQAMVVLAYISDAIACILLLLTSLFWFIKGGPIYNILAVYNIIFAMGIVIYLVATKLVSKYFTFMRSFLARGILRCVLGLPMTVVPPRMVEAQNFTDLLILFGILMITVGFLELAAFCAGLRFPPTRLIPPLPEFSARYLSSSDKREHIVVPDEVNVTDEEDDEDAVFV
ncbi:hypothetical protein HDU84_006926 [Entophlyctis sp. JEL0112]|nr:hypothetical protein HDU84_006926 [Entophlyctis sp. JEL0112]